MRKFILAGLLLAGSAQAATYDMEQCEWVADRGRTLAAYRDAGHSQTEAETMVWHSGAPIPQRRGLIGLTRFVYRFQYAPDETYDYLLKLCQRYEE